jgi:hypothetical protein
MHIDMTAMLAFPNKFSISAAHTQKRRPQARIRSVVPAILFHEKNMYQNVSNFSHFKANLGVF